MVALTMDTLDPSRPPVFGSGEFLQGLITVSHSLGPFMLKVVFKEKPTGQSV